MVDRLRGRVYSIHMIQEKLIEKKFRITKEQNKFIKSQVKRIYGMTEGGYIRKLIDKEIK